MSFESPDNEKNFPGLYSSVSDQASVSEEDHDRSSKKKDLGKKKDGKKDKKEKGYMMFEEEDSEEDLVSMDDVKSPTKIKKMKGGFKFPARKDIFPKKEKEEKKEKEQKKEEKKREDKDGKKVKKEKKKSKLSHHEVPAVVVAKDYDQPIFGVPLALAVDRNKSHDGIELPAIFRECVDYIEEYGLACEGIYRISGVKSKVQHLKDCYNKGIPAYLQEHEPNVIASLLKQFLRDLPEPVLTTAMMPKFEEASTSKSEKKKIELFTKLIDDLPICNKLLLSWMIVHMTHIIALQKENKMSLQNVSIVLSPTMQISHRVLNVLFSHAEQLFSDTIVKRYVPPLKPATSRWSLELPDNPTALEEELAKQESLLNQLHGELNAGVKDPDKEEQLWEVQRVVTQLKRKIKFAKKSVEANERRRKDFESKKLSTPLQEEEELDLTPKKPESKKKMAPAIPTSKEKPKETVKEKAKSDEKSEKEKDVSKETESESQKETVNEKKDEKEAENENEAETQKEAGKQEVAKEADGKTITVEAEVVKSAEETTGDSKEDTKEEEMKEKRNSKEVANREKKEGKESVKEKKEAKSEKVKKVEQPTLQPHIHLSSIPLQPIKAEPPVTPKKEETMDESMKKSVELRELEEEFLGDGKPEKKVKFTETPTECEMEEDEEDEEEEAESPQTEVEIVERDWEPIDDEELQRLLEEEEAMKMEEEELLAIGDELRQKIETEQSEIERLHQEIQELQYLRQDSDLEDMSSSSDSSYDSDDEEDLQEMLGQLIIDNEDLEKKNAELCQKIHEERMICLSVKLQIRLLQHRQLETSQASVGGNDRETFL